jgi:protein-disulfide isomerase
MFSLFPLTVIPRVASLLCIYVVALPAQSPTNPDELSELRRQVDSLQQGQIKLQKDLGAILGILSGKKPPLDDVFVKIAESPSRGQRDAKVTLVEFTDFQCPFCGAYARQTYPRIIDEYVKPGKVRYVSRNFPLESHPLAHKAAEAAACADDQGKFWELHDRFFVNQDKLAAADVAEHANAIGASARDLQRCIENGKYAARVDSDMRDGRDMRVGGTPTFFIGYTNPGDPSRIRAVRSIIGSAPYSEFQKAIAEALEASGPGAEEEK